MARKELALLASRTADSVPDSPAGLRVVVVVTDASGQFVGVGSTTNDRDTRAILWCALNGGDRQSHSVRG